MSPLLWLPNVERISCGTSGGTYIGGPFRIVLHRTEGSGIEGALAAYRAKNVQPHLTVDLHRRRVVQHLPFDVASRALQNKAGGVETNRRSTIQIEVVGFSANSPLDSDEDVQWFGRTVLGPIMRAYRIAATAPRFYGPGCGWTLAVENARQRMSYAQWNSFNGICSHQHVPEQSHWDAGEFKIGTALAAATAIDQEDDMTPEEHDRQVRIEEMLENLLGQFGYTETAPGRGDFAWRGIETWDSRRNPDGTPRKLSLLDFIRESHRELMQALGDRPTAGTAPDTILGNVLNIASNVRKLVAKSGA